MRPDPAAEGIVSADELNRLSDLFRQVTLWDIATGRAVKALTNVLGAVNDLKFSPDGSRIVAGSSYDRKGEAAVFQVADTKLIAKLEGQNGPVYTVAYRPDGQQVASGGFDGVVRLHDPYSGQLLKEFTVLPAAK